MWKRTDPGSENLEQETSNSRGKRYHEVTVSGPSQVGNLGTESFFTVYMWPGSLSYSELHVGE